ncbi:beta-L-arabinofuranosidase domain-containing protein [Flavivirga sp. 57AJ16]|uniref:beta-L-arabinofuranosidase domain-containing protein n=1 Tax=Flavivirga sp. 57AJ16 TaxID=3025307 RepID=UPI0023670A3C|nr:beta-L-arabinofuranosidase domain-containing protein [Flavivirga sp. 57AJ16]MDD7884742.1 glycoside hydrolase family 127 protein [Flavivirga sp. 57AJ16]
MIFKKTKYFLGAVCGFIVLLVSCNSLNTKVEQVSNQKIPDTSSINVNYISNKKPLVSSALIKLPVGAVTPKGWMKETLERQANGLLGHLGEISAWLQKENNAWLSNNGNGAWGWEEVPYWLKGYGNTAYILQDEKMISETKEWIEAAMSSQRADGNFGPVRLGSDGSQDFWPNMIMLYCLQSYYEYANDARVLSFMSKYFKYQLGLPDDQLLSKIHYWQRVRGGDNLYSVIWLYNRTGEKWLLELVDKIHRNTAPWSKRDNTLDDIKNWKEKREGTEWPEWYANLVDWHNVNVAQGFREPAQYYQLSHNTKDLNATYENFDIIRKHFGQVPGGMFGADENARPGYDDPRQGIETCGVVEQMNSNEHLLRITGDPFWADHTEEITFNTFPATMMPDLKSLRYITSPNMVINDDKNHRPGIMNEGPFLMMNPFSSRCCQHNHGQGWPYLVENSWMATPDNGLAATIYVPSQVKAKVAQGKEVKLSLETQYPFEDDLKFTFNASEKISFPLYLRIPSWCKNALLSINNKTVDMAIISGQYAKIDREWKDGDVVILSLPKELKVRKWKENHNSVSIDYGPLTFSLNIDENYIRKESDKTAIGDSQWQEGVDKEKWPSYEIYPSTPWNYGLLLDEETPENSFTIETRKWPESNYPFTPASTPIVLKAKAKRIPKWTIDKHDLVSELQDSPVKSLEKTESVELVPMGAARLRITAFPVIGNGEDAKEWKSN